MKIFLASSLLLIFSHSFLQTLSSTLKNSPPPYNTITDDRSMSISYLLNYTNDNCNYITGMFEESFPNATLNLGFWEATGAYPCPSSGKSTVSTPYGNQDCGGYQAHCPASGQVGAANPSSCTYMTPSNLKFPLNLANYGYPNPGTGYVDPKGNYGLGMTLSQRNCFNADGSNNPACCDINTLNGGIRTNVCASWAGAHLQSQLCVQYGIYESEVMFN